MLQLHLTCLQCLFAASRKDYIIAVVKILKIVKLKVAKEVWSKSVRQWLVQKLKGIVL